MDDQIIIFDPATHMPGLKKIFPNSLYYAIDPTESPFLRYETTIHLDKQRFNEIYKFEYNSDITSLLNINNDKILFLTLPLLDCVEGSKWTKPYGLLLMKVIQKIINASSWKKVVLFDTYDYDYDPSKLNLNCKIDYFFKRNYNKTKSYGSNVIPFPFQMFVLPCVLNTICSIDTSLFEHNHDNKINKIMWCGNLYNHVDESFKVYRMRQNIYDKIKNHVYSTGRISESEYHQKIKEYKICLDLAGVGDPNKRTFEILMNNSLLFTMIKDLEWGFEDGEHFEPETIFENEEDFYTKSQSLLNNQELYNKCINTQMKIVKKYFNIDYFKRYIIKKISL